MKKIFVFLTLLSAASLFCNAQTFVFIGDSITDGGWGSSAGRGIPSSQRNLTDLNHIYGHSYVMLCAGDYGARYYKYENKFYNRGISGDTVAGILARCDNDMLQYKPDVVSILVGINDASRDDFDIAAWEKTYRSLLDKTMQALPGVHIMLCTPFVTNVGRTHDSGKYETLAARVAGEASVVHRLASDYGAVLVPFDEMFAGLLSETPAAHSDYWIWDGVHPTAAGHRKMADLWMQQYYTAPARVTVALPGGKAPSAPDGPFQASWESLKDNYSVPRWFTDAKFGIFIHWGVYSVPAAGSEWYPKHMYNGMNKYHTETWGPSDTFGYKDFIPLFKADKFDPSAWAELFREAGARYVVMTAEHHDGFAMYASDLTEWNALDKGPHRDLIGDLSKAVRSEGLKFGVSYHRIENWDFMSPAKGVKNDLYDPEYAGLYGPPQKPSVYGSAMGPGFDKNGNPVHPQNDAFLEEWLARAEEIVTKYQPDLFYFDNGVNSRSLDPWKLRFAQYYYNSAAKWGRSVSIQTKSADYLYGNIKAYERESRAPKTIESKYWQVDDPIGNKFGYIEGLQLQSAGNVIGSLVNNISKNGNLCLNISPKSDGTIPENQQAVLREVGAWLKVNGEGVYGTSAWKVYGEGKDVENNTSDHEWRFTVKGKNLYAFSLDWNGGEAFVKSLNTGNAGKVRKIELLGQKGSLKFRQTADGLKIMAPSAKPGSHISVFKITL